jgi:hypothetical protein
MALLLGRHCEFSQCGIIKGKYIIIIIIGVQVKKFLNPYIVMEEDFEDTLKDLIGVFLESKDNVRFLSTLERHFKNVVYGIDFKVCSLVVISKLKIK